MRQQAIQSLRGVNNRGEKSEESKRRVERKRGHHEKCESQTRGDTLFWLTAAYVLAVPGYTPAYLLTRLPGASIMPSQVCHATAQHGPFNPFILTRLAGERHKSFSRTIRHPGTSSQRHTCVEMSRSVCIHNLYRWRKLHRKMLRDVSSPTYGPS